MITILLAEDTVELSEIMAEMLVKQGYNVITAKNGMEALRLFKSNTDINAIITDLKMPMMTGVQLVSEVRTLDQRIPIIMWSGSEDPNLEALTAFFPKNRGSREVISLLNDFFKSQSSSIMARKGS